VSGDAGPQRKRFWTEAKERGQVTTTLWKDLPTTTNGTQHLKKLFQDSVFDNPKPEGLMERIIQLSTNENDIVLDFHLGSGTTMTTAHKMNRRYIGIEQMDYIEEVPVKRLQKVILGEDGGISKNVNWIGGGSFVYFELMPLQQKLLNEILLLDSNEKLIEMLDRIKQNKSLKYSLSINKIEELSIDFAELDYEDKKKTLLNFLDKNEDYVAVSDYNDEDFSISKLDKVLTEKFYLLYE
jgi:adenine-specific DNA-methyltransferase